MQLVVGEPQSLLLIEITHSLAWEPSSADERSDRSLNERGHGYSILPGELAHITQERLVDRYIRHRHRESMPRAPPRRPDHRDLMSLAV